MEKRLKEYLKHMAEMKLQDFSEEQRSLEAEKLLKQITFFQHERLIHLIVTVTFALLMMLAVIFTAISETAFCLALPAVLLILLVPYIRHYYILENGVQKLYTYYDKLIGKEIVKEGE